MTVKRLSESIAHIEDLPVDEFISALRNLGSMTAQEKFDGANLWVGVDDQGQMFTSREGKRENSERRYKPEDWPLVSAYNQFRAAHAALVQVEPDVKRIMRAGDTVEAEVLFGRQPNSVVYGQGGKSFVAFLRGVLGTPDDIAEHLSSTLHNQTVEARVMVVDTDDGETLNDVEQSFQFMFTAPQKIDSTKLKASAGITGRLDKLEAFLRAPSSVKNLSNKELLTINLQQVDRDARPGMKAARAAVLAQVQTEFKLPIKQALLDKIVRKIRSSLTDENTTDEEDIGIEGIVLRNPSTGNQIKIVDKDIFTTINKFNQSARGQVQSALNTVDPDAPVESRGGLVGALRIKIAEVLGNRDLAKGANVRKILEPIKGSSPEEAITNMAKSMNIGDYQMVKKKILALTAESAQELSAMLKEFKEHQGSYRLKLKTGREMGLSAETVKRTLLTFAEAKRNLTNLFDKFKLTKSLPQLLAVLYGSQAKAVHQTAETEEITEMLREFHGDIDQDEYAKKSWFVLLNAYLSTVFMTMLIYQTGDKIGLRKLRDRKNYMLKKWDQEMSPLNFWGYLIWRNGTPPIKKILSKHDQGILYQATKHVNPTWWKLLHRAFSFNKLVDVKYDDHQKTLQRLIDLAGLRSDRLNSLLDWMVRWPELSYDEQVKALAKLYMHAMQFVPNSTLFTRLRVIQDNLLLNPTGKNDQMVQEGTLLKNIAALTEDAEAGDGQPTGQPVNATTASSIAAVPSGIGGQRAIVKRRRNPGVVKAMTMKFPDPRKKNEPA